METTMHILAFDTSFKEVIAFAELKANITAKAHEDISQCFPFVLFSLMFCDEIPLDTIKSLHKSPLKLHNYRKKNHNPH